MRRNGFDGFAMDIFSIRLNDIYKNNETGKSNKKLTRRVDSNRLARISEQEILSWEGITSLTGR